MKMKNDKKQVHKKKRTILAVSLVGVVVLFGGTIAYHSTTGFFANLFHVGYWQNKTTEEFVPESDWSTCETVPKKVIGKNTGTMTATVRLKYEEYWKAAGSTSTDHTTELPLLDGDNDPIASVNLQHLDEWTLGSDGWYYYNWTLEPGDETSSLLKSVTLNCKNNFAGENSVCTTEGSATTCTKPNNQYDDAKYHVFVTVEYLQASGCEDVGWAECADQARPPLTLYQIIARRSKGVDTNITDYTDINVPSGVYTYKEDPGTGDGNDDAVHYFRGDIYDNHLKIKDICWRVIRTTTSGGVKIIYDGKADAQGACGQGWGYNDIFLQDRYNFSESDLAAFGYMYGTKHPFLQDMNDESQYTWGNDVSYQNGAYTLVGTSGDSAKNYSCRSGSNTSCSTVYYRMTEGAYLPLSGGEKINDAVASAFTNTTDSNLKKMNDQWYVDNLSDVSSLFEDTVFCNDRSLDPESTLASKDNTYKIRRTVYLGAGARGWETYQNAAHKFRVTLECSKNDSFSTGSDIGNGKLTYPVGFITADEASMVGENERIRGCYEHGWLNQQGRGGYFIIPSPQRIYVDSVYGEHPYSEITGGFPYGLSIFTTKDNASSSVRPVVSLVPRIVPKGGDGSAEHPWIIEP